MKIFGKTPSEYLRFGAPILALVVLVAFARLALSLAGVPNSAVRWLSVTGVLFLGAAYFGARAQATGFGGYRHLLPLVFIQSALGNLIIIAAIVVAIVTGHDNIYTLPEYSGGGEGKTWAHVLGHLVFGLVMGPLVTWVLACGAYLVTRKLAPRRPAASPIV
jgi:hypothetical protein